MWFLCFYTIRLSSSGFNAGGCCSCRCGDCKYHIMSVKEVDIFLISKRYFIFYENLNACLNLVVIIAIMLK